MSGHGGRRANTGGARPGAGRPKLPRLSPEAATAALRELYLSTVAGTSVAGVLPGDWGARLAAILGVDRQAIHRATVQGATVEALTRWGVTIVADIC